MNCPRCNGTGQVRDPREYGAAMRKLRELAGLSLRHVATRMGITAPYLSDLELGRRAFNNVRVIQYRRIVGPKLPDGCASFPP
jgi:predicted transcriptional regulator